MYPNLSPSNPEQNAHIHEKLQNLAAATWRPFQNNTVVVNTTSNTNFVDDNSLQRKLNNSHNIV